jgi:hypothetical protein
MCRRHTWRQGVAVTCVLTVRSLCAMQYRVGKEKNEDMNNARGPRVCGGGC